MDSQPNRTTSRHWRLTLAIVLWLGVLAWSNIPPYRGNVREQERSFFVWHWQLYSRTGEGICDVRYFDMNDGGAPIERWTLFGYEQPGDMPDKLARTEKQQLIPAYQEVCSAKRKADGVAPHIEVEARCAVHGAWKQVESRKRDVCTIKIKPNKAGGAK